MNDKFITLSWTFIKDKKTTMNEKLILMEISNLSMLELGCIASNSHFSELMGVKKEAISRLISSLEKKGYISSKIKNGSRNFSRTITLNKMLFDPKQNVISPLTNCLETKGNITTNITLSKYDDFLSQLEKACKYKSKVTKTKNGEKLFKQIVDVSKLFKDYISYQKENGNFSVRITDYMRDYETVHSIKEDKELTDEEFWSMQGNN
jgi:hypothetical protein